MAKSSNPRRPTCQVTMISITKIKIKIRLLPNTQNLILLSSSNIIKNQATKTETMEKMERVLPGENIVYCRGFRENRNIEEEQIKADGKLPRWWARNWERNAAICICFSCHPTNQIIFFYFSSFTFCIVFIVWLRKREEIRSLFLLGFSFFIIFFSFYSSLYLALL